MRVKSPRLQRHNKVLKITKGFRMTKNRLYKVAHEAARHAGQYAFAGRRLRRRDLRSLWITRINAALTPLNVSYSRFIDALVKSHIEIDRRVLSELATHQPQVFNHIVKTAGFTNSK
jgi:large subunit ribosomal protein L20